jgi:hypothetical protein
MCTKDVAPDHTAVNAILLLRLSEKNTLMYVTRESSFCITLVPCEF